LGYVGLPLALALARAYSVVGFDISETRVAELKRGYDRTGETPPAVLRAATLTISDDPSAISGADYFIVTVPTPVDENNRPDLGHLREACQTVGKALKKGAVVVFESTVYPGVTEDVCGPVLEKASRLRVGENFFLGYSPERINPGDRDHTVDKITKVVAGQTPEVTKALSELYGAITSGGVFVAKNIKTAEQLKGGILGSSDLTGSSFIAIQFALGKLGLSEKDVAIIRSGGTRERLAALRGRRIQATVLSPPTSFMAQNEGFNLLTDVTGMPFQHNGVVTTRRIIRQSPDLVRRYVKSQVEAVHLMKTDRETGIKVLMKFMRAKEEDREVVGRSYDLSVGDDVYPRKQYPTLAGIKTILDAVAKEDPKAAQVRPEDFVDVRFIRELDQSGFIDNLYKGKKS